MNPLLIAGGLFLFVILTSKDGLANVFNPIIAFVGGPGPGAQVLKQNPMQGKSAQAGPPNYSQGTGQGSPNSTLATIGSAMVIVNNALNQIDRLPDYFGSNADSEVPPQPMPQNYAPPDMTQVTVDAPSYILGDRGGFEIDDPSSYV